MQQKSRDCSNVADMAISTPTPPRTHTPAFQWVLIDACCRGDLVMQTAPDAATSTWRVQSVSAHPGQHWRILLFGEAGTQNLDAPIGTWVRRIIEK